jgi:hypothetical protein
VLLHVTPDEVIRNGVAAESRDIEQFSSTLCAEEVIGVDGAPDTIHARAQQSFTMVHGHTGGGVHVGLERHDLVQVGKSTTFWMMDEDTVDLGPLLAQSVCKKHFLCFTVDTNHKTCDILLSCAVDHATVTVRVPRPFMIKEFLLASLKLGSSICLSLQKFLNERLATWVGINTNLNGTLEKFLQFHDGRRKEMRTAIRVEGRTERVKKI